MTQEKALIKRDTAALMKAGVFTLSLVATERERAMVLVTIGFHPAQHLTVYQNRVMVNDVGVLWWARRGYQGPDYVGADDDFRMVTVPISKIEAETYGVGTREIGVLVRIFRATDNPQTTPPLSEGFGRASLDGEHPVQRGNSVEREHPYLMAVKRARGQALRQFRPLGVRVQSVEDAIQTGVDLESGEVVEGAATVVPEPKANAQAAPMGDCPKGHGPFRRRQGRDGQPDWWSCGGKLTDGSWCKERPAQKRQDVDASTGEIIEGHTESVAGPDPWDEGGNSSPGSETPIADEREAARERVAAKRAERMAPMPAAAAIPPKAPTMPAQSLTTWFEVEKWAHQEMGLQPKDAKALLGITAWVQFKGPPNEAPAALLKAKGEPK